MTEALEIDSVVQEVAHLAREEQQIFWLGVERVQTNPLSIP